MNAATPGNPVTPQRIGQMAWGYAPPLVIEAAVQHGFFEALQGQGKTAEQIAAVRGVNVRGARMILNVLVGLELLTREQDRYVLTPESATFLVPGKENYRGALFGHISRQLLPAWLGLAEVVRTGQPAHAVNDAGEGAAFFSQFVESIYPLSAQPARALAEHLRAAAGPQPKVLDIAAGSGVWGIEVAKAWPGAQVTAVDWPTVIAVTRRVARQHGVIDRFRFVEGNMHEVDYGQGYRLATLGQILHSEGEAASRALLKKVGRSLAPGGTIAIAEFLCNEDRKGPPLSLIFAVNMLVNTAAGDTFTFGQISQWLSEAGFKNMRQLPMEPSPLILADYGG